MNKALRPEPVNMESDCLPIGKASYETPPPNPPAVRAVKSLEKAINLAAQITGFAYKERILVSQWNNWRDKPHQAVMPIPFDGFSHAALQQISCTYTQLRDFILDNSYGVREDIIQFLHRFNDLEEFVNHMLSANQRNQH